MADSKHPLGAHWFEGQPRDNGQQHIVCPPELMPTVRQNMASFGLAIDWPDVCYCPVNGGEGHQVHEVQANCLNVVDNAGNEWCKCDTPEATDHIEGCPFDVCPLGTCHPMCSQVTGDANEAYCHCACHG